MFSLSDTLNEAEALGRKKIKRIWNHVIKDWIVMDMHRRVELRLYWHSSF